MNVTEVYSGIADFNSMINEIKKLINAFMLLNASQNKIPGNIQSIVVSLNDENVALVKTVTELDAANIATIRYNSATQKSTVSIKNISAALERQRLAQAALNAETFKAKASADFGVAAIRAGKPTNPFAAQATPVETYAFDKALSQVRRLAAESKVAGAVIYQMWVQAQKGTMVYDAALDRLQLSLKKAVVAETLRGNTAQLASKQSIIASTQAMAAATQSATAITTATDAGTAGLEKTKKATDSAKAASQSFLISWQSFGRLLTIQLLHQAISQLSQAMRQGTKDAMELQTRIAEIQTISQSAQLSTSQWAAGLRSISESFGIDILDVAEASYQTLSNQMARGAATFDFVREAARLATITVSKNSEAVDALSSIMNAYGKEAGTAREISDKLFVAVNLGRFRLEEIASSLGGITVIGKEAGASMDELYASMIALTISGFTPANAMTQIRGAMSQLIKPSQDMKKFLDEIGASSGEVAVKTYGLIGVFELLRQHADRVGGSISEEVRNLRGLLFALNVTGEGHRAYVQAMAELGTATTQANAAFKLMMTTNTKTIQQELEKVKNYFRIEFGTAFLKTLAEISQSLGGFLNVIKTTTTIVSTAILGMATAGIIKLIFFRKELDLTTKSMQIAAANAQAAGRIWRTAFIATGIFEVAMLTVRAMESVNEEQLAAMNNFKQAIADRKKELEGAFTQTMQPLNMLITQTYTLLNVKVGELLSQINANINEAKKGAEDIAKVIDEAISFMTSNLRDQLSDVRKTISDTVKEINDARKFLIDTKKDFEDLDRDIKVQSFGDDPAKKLQNLQNELQRLNKEAANVENVDQLKSIRSEMTRTIKEAANLQNDIDKKNDSNAKDRKAAEIALREAKEKRGRQERTDLAKIESLEGKAHTQRNKNALDRARQTKKDHDRDLGQAVEKAQEEFDQHKKIEYKKLDISRASAKARNILEAKDKELGGKAAVSLVTDKGLFDKEKTIEEQILRLKNIGLELSRLDFAKILATEDPKRLQQFFDERVKFIEELMTVYQNKLSMVPELEAKKLEEIVRQLAQEKLAVVLKLEEKPRLEGQADDIKLALQNFNQSIESLKQSQIRAQTVRATMEASVLKGFATVAENYKQIPIGKQVGEALLRIREKPETAQAELVKFPSSVIDVIEKAGGFDRRGLELFNQAVSEQVSITKRLEEATGQARATFINLGGDIRTFDAAVKAAGLSTPAAIEGMNKAFTETTTSLYTFKKALDTFDIPKAPESQEPRGKKALGGMMFGQDSIPAMLSPGEFVMNAMSTRKYYSQLVAMNSVGRFSGGGQASSTTNVGDINVSLQSSGNESTDVIRLGRLLQREIRRGTVSLS